MSNRDIHGPIYTPSAYAILWLFVKGFLRPNAGSQEIIRVLHRYNLPGYSAHWGLRRLRDAGYVIAVSSTTGEVGPGAKYMYRLHEDGARHLNSVGWEPTMWDPTWTLPADAPVEAVPSAPQVVPPPQEHLSTKPVEKQQAQLLLDAALDELDDLENRTRSREENIALVASLVMDYNSRLRESMKAEEERMKAYQKQRVLL